MVIVDVIIIVFVVVVVVVVVVVRCCHRDRVRDTRHRCRHRHRRGRWSFRRRRRRYIFWTIQFLLKLLTIFGICVAVTTLCVDDLKCSRGVVSGRTSLERSSRPRLGLSSGPSFGPSWDAVWTPPPKTTHFQLSACTKSVTFGSDRARTPFEPPSGVFSRWSSCVVTSVCRCHKLHENPMNFNGFAHYSFLVCLNDITCCHTSAVKVRDLKHTVKRPRR